MDSSRRSLRAFSGALPLKKEIDQTLLKVQLEKRKFLTQEREQTYLKQTLDKKRKELNDLKAKQPQTQTLQARARQTNKALGNVDKNYLAIYDNIQQLKSTIDLHRKQIRKFKELNKHLQTDINALAKTNDNTNTLNLELETRNQQLKEEILQYREKNLKNTTEFRQSHTNINKSNSNDENLRKKFSVKQKSFLGEQIRNSKMIPFDGLSDALRSSGIKFSEHVNEIMSGSLPLAKKRIRIEIAKNKEKLKISESYKKFGENLESMFQIMKEYKGRDDLDFIAKQFVTKEKQLQKIEQYVAQLEARIDQAQGQLRAKQEQDDNLEREVNAKIEKEDEKYVTLQQIVKRQINSLKNEQVSFYEWFHKVGSILMPLLDEPLTRNNASNQIGQIQSALNIQKGDIDKKPQVKSIPLPAIEIPQRQVYSQMMNYDKLRDFASEYVKSKKNL